MPLEEIRRVLTAPDVPSRNELIAAHLSRLEEGLADRNRLADLPDEPLSVTRRLVVLVNGLPGAGKTTLARTLSQRLRVPLFSKDTIKEAHADVLGAEPPPGWSQRRWNSALGAAASETMWALLADVPGDAVLESCWPRDVRHFVVQHRQRARDWQPVEIWCEAPLETARRRFEARHPRHPIHGELLTDTEWERWRVTGRPLEVGPTFRIDTTGAVDTNAIITWINRRGVIDPQEPVTDAISEGLP